MNKVILNLTQHPATPDQLDQGVIDLTGNDLIELKALLNFETPPSCSDIERRSASISRLARELTYPLTEAEHVEKVQWFAMIGGAPFLMSALESALLDSYITPVYAFSQRVSVEATNDAGEVIKTNVFKHIGFV